MRKFTSLFIGFLLLLSQTVYTSSSKKGEASKGSSSSSSSQATDLDLQMRQAYAKWEEATKTYNLEMTQAYDVVGFLAAILGDQAKRYFNETSFNYVKNKYNKRLGQAHNIVLKEEYRSAEYLSKFFSNNFCVKMKTTFDSATSSIPQNLLLISDFGEECDDEITALLAHKIAKIVGIKIHIIFTSPRAEEQISLFQRWLGEASPVTTSALSTPFDLKAFLKKDERNTILQIGPVHASRPEGAHFLENIAQNLSGLSYQYYLLGAYGASVNSKAADALAVPSILNTYSHKTFIVDTLAGKGAFKFTYKALAYLFGSKHPIIDHVIKIGWRNTVGRAHPGGGKFIAHLVASDGVGPQDGGANYEVARNIMFALQKAEAPKAKKLTAEEGVKAQTLAKQYLEALKTWGARLSVNPATDETNSMTMPGLTSLRIFSGYTDILITLYQWFGVPIAFFESGRPELWKKQWETPSLADRERAEELGQLFQEQALVK